jgi:hypothetical protein
MQVYKISSTQGQISFKKNIKASSYQDAKNKFYNEINKTNNSFPYIHPDIEIENIFRRY